VGVDRHDVVAEHLVAPARELCGQRRLAGAGVPDGHHAALADPDGVAVQHEVVALRHQGPEHRTEEEQPDLFRRRPRGGVDEDADAGDHLVVRDALDGDPQRSPWRQRPLGRTSAPSGRPVRRARSTSASLRWVSANGSSGRSSSLARARS